MRHWPISLLLALLVTYCTGIKVAKFRRILRHSNDSKDSCQIPTPFQGVWQSEQKETVTITETDFSGKGTCIGGKNLYFLFQLSIGTKTCWRCVGLFLHHSNIVAYKETKCRYELPAEKKCRMNMFDGDAVMVTLFRVDSTPQLCPLQGSYKFHYTDYRGACKSRSSVGHSCAKTSQLQHQFEACPEAQQSESKTETLHCIGSWIENGKKFFAAKMSTGLSTPSEFRCFIYQYDHQVGTIGQSADASCRDLTDIQTAPTRINLQFENPPHRHACSFKHSLVENVETQRKHQWESLQSSLLHKFDSDIWIVSDQSGANVTVRQCVTHKKESGHVIEYVTYTTDKCVTGFQCIRVYHRSKQIVEAKIGHLTNNFNEACSMESFFDETAPFETLVATDSELKPCPNHHRYKIHTCNQDDSTLSFGCDNQNHFVINYKCNRKHQGTHNCLGHWKENTAEYLILRDVQTLKKSCFVYSRHGHSLMLSGSHGDSCQPSVIPGVNSHIVFNASQSGLCSPTASAYSSSHSPLLSTILVIAVAILVRVAVG